jgi:hypothetical protein
MMPVTPDRPGIAPVHDFIDLIGLLVLSSESARAEFDSQEIKKS